MNHSERRAIRHYLLSYPDGWSFKRIVDHLYYEFDETPEVIVRDIYSGVTGDELGALINRECNKLEAA